MTSSIFRVSCLTLAITACFSTNVLASYGQTFNRDTTLNTVDIQWNGAFRIKDAAKVEASDSTITVSGEQTSSKIMDGQLTVKNLSTQGNLELQENGKLTVLDTLKTQTFTNTSTSTVTITHFQGNSLNNQGLMTVNSLEVGEKITTSANSVLNVESGQIKGKVENRGLIYLNSENAKIDGTLYLYDGAELKQNETTNLKNLEVTQGKVSISNDLTIENNLLVSSANIFGDLTVGGKFIQTHTTTNDYTIFRSGSSATIGTIESSLGKYGIKVQNNSMLEVDNMIMSGVADVDGGQLQINQSASIGGLHNTGTVDAPDAVITVTGEQTLTDQYTFTNGLHIGSSGDIGDKANSTFIAKSLSVNGNALNQSADGGSSKLLVNQIAINGDYTNAGITSISHGSGTFKSITSENGSLELEDSVLEVKNGSSLGKVKTMGDATSTISLGTGDYTMDSFSGDNKVLLLNDIKNTTVGIDSKEGHMTIAATGTANDQYSNVAEAIKALQSKVSVSNTDPNVTDQVEIAEGTINNGYMHGQETKNSKLDAFSSVNVLSALTLRHEMNTLSKRMGELRDTPKGVGVWARYYGSEMEFGTQHLKSKNNSIQMGSDYSVGDWKMGIALNYTDGESRYANGNADNKNYGLALYGTWFVPCGAYIDLMAKYTRLSNDFALNGMNGSYDNNAFNLSAETGYRFEFMQGGVFVEPQIGLNYGRIMGDEFITANQVRIEQDDYDSLIGRIGVRTGFKFPKDKGLIYARFAGLYDFQGEMTGKASTGNSANTFESDLGGSWFELGVGANFNWTKNTYSYIDFERTNGGDIKENYRWNIGIRHTW